MFSNKKPIEKKSSPVQKFEKGYPITALFPHYDGIALVSLIDKKPEVKPDESNPFLFSNTLGMKDNTILYSFSTMSHRKKESSKTKWFFTINQKESQSSKSEEALSMQRSAEYKPYILPNGFWFHIYHNEEDNKDYVQLYSKTTNISRGDFNEKIDPSRIAIVKDSPDERSIVCAGKDNNTLYLYHMNYDDGLLIGWTTPIPTVKSSREIQIKLEENEKITSLASFPGLANQPVAIATNHGKILMMQLKEGTLVPYYELYYQAPIASEAKESNLELLASEKGCCLISYCKEKSSLCLYNILHHYMYQEIGCHQLMQLRMASNGEYFSAIAYSETGESKQAYIFSVQPLKMYPVTLDHPASTMAIGGDNALYVAKGSVLENLGDVHSFLMNHNEEFALRENEPEPCLVM